MKCSWVQAEDGGRSVCLWRCRLLSVPSGEQASGRSFIDHVVRRYFGTKCYSDVPAARRTRDGDTGNEDCWLGQQQFCWFQIKSHFYELSNDNIFLIFEQHLEKLNSLYKVKTFINSLDSQTCFEMKTSLYKFFCFSYPENN